MVDSSQKNLCTQHAMVLPFLLVPCNSPRTCCSDGIIIPPPLSLHFRKCFASKRSSSACGHQSLQPGAMTLKEADTHNSICRNASVRRNDGKRSTSILN